MLEKSYLAWLSSFLNCGQSPLCTASKRVVLNSLPATQNKSVIKSQYPWNQPFCSLKLRFPCYMLRCRRPGLLSINHGSDLRHGLASVASDLQNLSEIITTVLAFFDGRPIFLLSLRNYYQMEGINHKRNFCIKAAEASCYVKFRNNLLLWHSSESCVIQMRWQFGKTITESLGQIFSCLTDLFSSRQLVD